MEESNLLTRARAAHLRSAALLGGIPMEPSKDSDVRVVNEKTYVVLRNVSGILRVYRVRNDGKLKALKRWPAALE